jgi:hypothetical protein
MSDDYFDLIIWYNGESIHGFQLCYGKPSWERALTWIQGRGFSHTEVDSGEDEAEQNRTPILLPNGLFPAKIVRREFERRSADLPEKLRQLVIGKIAAFSGRRIRRALVGLGALALLVASTFIASGWIERHFCPEVRPDL